MAVSAPTDKRFRRAHVSPARRRRLPRVSRRQLVSGLLGVVAVVYAVYRLVDFGFNSDALTITRITLSGATRLSSEDVRARLDALRGQNMLVVDLEAWRQKVLEAPWVEAAAMRRVLPGSIDVSIVERRPMGVGRIAGTLYLVDQGGEVVDEYGPSHGDFDLPIIDGLAVRGSASGRDPAVEGGRAALVGRLMASLQTQPDLAKRVSQIDVTDPHDAVVILDGDTAMVRLGEERFVERLQAYLDVASALREQVPQIDYVDLRFGERVYVRPQAARRVGRRVVGGG
jgi:cell division protein FtsQ